MSMKSLSDTIKTECCGTTCDKQDLINRVAVLERDLVRAIKAGRALYTLRPSNPTCVQGAITIVDLGTKYEDLS